MGDRGNIAVKQYRESEERVYLYTHWGGAYIGDVVKRALEKKWRWNDAAYLTRIIFDVLTDGSHGEETGFGISVRPPDNEHLILEVDPSDQMVRARSGRFIDHKAGLLGEVVEVWTFEEFIELPDASEALATLENKE